MVRVLIINAHSIENKGDAGIILSMIDSIKSEIRDVEIAISSRYWKKDKDYYKQQGIETLPQIFEYPESNLPFFKRLKFILKEFIFVNRNKNKVSKNCTIEKKRLIKWYNEADIIVSCGGGFILSNHKFLIEPSLLSHLYQILFAAWKQKKILIYSQTIGPFNSKLSKKITSHILSKVGSIFVRENISKKYLKELGINNVTVVPDSAFSLIHREVDITNIFKNSDRKIVGITLRQWKFPNHENPKKLFNNYIESVAESIIYLVSNNYNIVLIPQVVGPTDYEDDRLANKELLKKIPTNFLPYVKDLNISELDAREMKFVYSNLYFLIGTRMHSNIFALSSVTPVLAISYETKTKGIMQGMGLEDYSIDIDKITVQNILNKLKALEENYDQYKLYLKKIVPNIIDDSKIPAKEIKKLVNSIE